MNFLAPNMFRQAQSRILFALLLAAPLTVCAQSAEPEARFSVVPGGPDSQSSVGYVREDFTFTAYVDEAVRYEVDFGDDTIQVREPGTGRSAVFDHPYQNPDTYTAKLHAFTEAGELIEPALTLTISVKLRPVEARPRPSTAEFSVRPSIASDPIADNPEVTWADFTFTAYVSQAERYELDFNLDDNDGAVEILPGSGGKAIRRHRYTNAGDYTARMTAWRNTGEAVEIELQVPVRAPLPAAAPAAAVQWPSVRTEHTVRPESKKTDITPWLLLAAIALLLLRRSAPTDPDPGTFEATRDRGSFEVGGSPTADGAVSMRVRRNKPQFVIADNAVVLEVRPRRDATRVDS